MKQDKCKKNPMILPNNQYATLNSKTDVDFAKFGPNSFHYLGETFSLHYCQSSVTMVTCVICQFEVLTHLYALWEIMARQVEEIPLPD